MQDILDILKDIPQRRIDTFAIFSIENITLPQRLFGKLLIKHVDLHIRTLNIDEDVFKGQETSLEKVGIVTSHLSQIPTCVIHNLEKLKAFGFMNSVLVKNVKEGEFKNFAGANNLEVLIYSMNRIETVERGAFDNLFNLKTLDLHFNNLKCIDLSNLPPKLPKKLELQMNKLTDIKLDIVTQMPFGGTIQLSSNNITSLGADLVREAIKNGVYLDLRYNYELKCDCSIMPLVIARNNGIRGFVFGSCLVFSDKRTEMELAKLSDLNSCKPNPLDYMAVMTSRSNQVASEMTFFMETAKKMRM
ncbi:Leucine-rich repeat-containing protein 15 [Nymphon striatum]|nr:Leucine-rich repeat-containing protein 15 [Nymphon striatum]